MELRLHRQPKPRGTAATSAHCENSLLISPDHFQEKRRLRVVRGVTSGAPEDTRRSQKGKEKAAGIGAAVGCHDRRGDLQGTSWRGVKGRLRLRVRRGVRRLVRAPPRQSPQAVRKQGAHDEVK
ncbi:hypothetical protein NDU88_003902 [Pleurodeles waltl]|uniref:Uncharacterized protein n=1 Tax=Pleurodeles waltl TaxID=8319 RepID=A0AAV7QB13_PLEWA|nr:hypothetical protein NDU88_003902 [Pleurodeles waltl]